MAPSRSSTPNDDDRAPLIQPHNIFLWLSNIQRDFNQQLASVNDSLLDLRTNLFAISQRQVANNTISEAIVAGTSLSLPTHPPSYPLQHPVPFTCQSRQPRSDATQPEGGVRDPSCNLISDNFDRDTSLPVPHRQKRRPGDTGRRHFRLVATPDSPTVGSRHRLPDERRPISSSPLSALSDCDSTNCPVLRSSRRPGRHPAYLDVLDQGETQTPYSWQDLTRDDFRRSDSYHAKLEPRSPVNSTLIRKGAHFDVLNPVETLGLHGATYRQTHSAYSVPSSPQQAHPYSDDGLGSSFMRHGHGGATAEARTSSDFAERSLGESCKRSREGDDCGRDNHRIVRTRHSQQHFPARRP